MSKKILAAFVIVGCFFLGPITSFSQEDGDYRVHIVKTGEVPSVLAKKYNVTIAELASLNKWGAKVVLHVGDKVKLPIGAHLSPVGDSSATAAPAIVAPVATTPVAAGKPVKAQNQTKPPTGNLPDTGGFAIHILQKGEVPSVLAKKYHVNVDELKDLNNWTPKTVWHVGEKVKLPRTTHSVETADSVVAKVGPKRVAPAVAASKPAADTTAKAVTLITPANQINYVVQKKETLYSISKKFNVSVVHLKDWNRLLEDKISEGQTLVIYTDKPVTQPVVAPKTAPDVAVKEAAAPVAPKPVAENKPVAPAVQPVANISTKPAVDSVAAEGYFTSLFGKEIAGKTLKSASGMAMTFKTASGWSDKKYYVLMNEAPPGSIVKITGADGKFVYGKILWNMGDPQDNEGLNFRISDAAASALGIKDMKFQVTVDYYK